MENLAPHQPLNLHLNLPKEDAFENDQAVIEALERYLRRSTLARPCPLPRWVMW